MPSPTELSVAVVSGVLRQTDSEPTSDSPDGDIVSDVGNEISVTLDRWTAGHLGIADLVAASIVMAVGFVLAWFVKRLIRRAADKPSPGTCEVLRGGDESDRDTHHDRVECAESSPHQGVRRYRNRYIPGIS